MSARTQLTSAAADVPRLQVAVAEAHIVPLLMSLLQLTGKTKYLEKTRPYITGGPEPYAGDPGRLAGRDPRRPCCGLVATKGLDGVKALTPQRKG